MLESQLEAMNPELYERLIDRLGLALDVARTASRLRDEAPVELELRGLSSAEYALINAYLASFPLPAVVADVPGPRHADNVIWIKDQRDRKGARKSGPVFYQQPLR